MKISNNLMVKTAFIAKFCLVATAYSTPDGIERDRQLAPRAVHLSFLSLGAGIDLALHETFFKFVFDAVKRRTVRLLETMPYQWREREREYCVEFFDSTAAAVFAAELIEAASQNFNPILLTNVNIEPACSTACIDTKMTYKSNMQP